LNQPEEEENPEGASEGDSFEFDVQAEDIYDLTVF